MLKKKKEADTGRIWDMLAVPVFCNLAPCLQGRLEERVTSFSFVSVITCAAVG